MVNLQPPDPPEPCDHDWEFVDDSFDHEFGTEVIHSWGCSICGLTTDKNPHADDEY